jgi:Methyl-accepting chemotaxis protein (MCP) signalling domain
MASEADLPPTAANTSTPERISALADTLLERIRGSIDEISEINLKARVLSINALIEASRAGDAGRAFSIVAQEMVSLSDSTQGAAKKLEQESAGLVRELAGISRHLSSDVRSTRLCDLALTNIDLIDRNLYERSCDCRWWATDAAMVSALENPDAKTGAFASERLGVILKAYTVYFDIVLADLDGNVIANGRPAEYGSLKSNHAEALWFTSALATASGDDFGFQSVHASPLVGGKRVLVYSCKVCASGNARSKPIGVLGVVFNWDGLAQKIMHETPIETGKKAATRVCIVDSEGAVLADSRDRMLQDKLSFTGQSTLFGKKKHSETVQIEGKATLVAHAQSPGFETYRTGWHSLILEQLKS